MMPPKYTDPRQYTSSSYQIDSKLLFAVYRADRGLNWQIGTIGMCILASQRHQLESSRSLDHPIVCAS
jgi:hypothetical protein